MEILLVLVSISVVLVAIAIGLYVWAVDRHQFDDLDRHGLDIFDNDARNIHEHLD